MKNILILIVVLFSTAIYSQTKVYGTTNGIRNILPSQVVKQENGKTVIYKTTNGIQNITPSKVIERKNDKIYIYSTKNGIQNINPDKIIINDNKINYKQRDTT